MDATFQAKFVVALADVFNDILDGEIFETDIFDEHLLIFTSALSNELINGCNSAKIVVQFNEYLDVYFDDGSFLMGLITVGVRMIQNSISNFTSFAFWGSVQVLTTLTFQVYWAGFSAGKIMRIFFYGRA
mmetsp:Transcript_31142/g.27538  ORF Transcript_31142/g.27538 Transcript_31142/m.27538 type:complete len:130 (-) Transcript_31142:35-424(-)